MYSGSDSSDSEDDFLLNGSSIAKKPRLRINYEDESLEESIYGGGFRDRYNQPKLRTFWMQDTFRKRIITGEFVTTCVPYMKHPEKFYKYFRMSLKTFEYVLNGIKDKITKKSIRTPISACERLCVTIRYLTTGLTFGELSHSFQMSPQVISNIISEVTAVIFDSFLGKHMPIPTPEDFKKIALEFEELWNFPHVIGAIDSKHCRIKRPANSGSLYCNNKNYYSIIMQGVADSHSRFLFIDVGAPGKQSDGSVFEASMLKTFLNNPQNIPSEEKIGNIPIEIPYFLVSDDAYPLTHYNIRPYSSKSNLSEKELIFNGRQNRARKPIECAFGILAHKFRLFFNHIETTPKNTESIVKCTAILHNIIIDLEGLDEVSKKVISKKRHEHNSTIKSNCGKNDNRSETRAIQIRENLADYFLTDGQVPWQSCYIR